MWEIQKFVGPHTCTSTRMIEDRGKLDSKTICTCIMPMVKDMPTIKVSILIAEMQARFQYRVSYRKVWIAKQMAIEQLFGDYDSSYNEIQRWIVVMWDYWNLSFLNTYTAYELEPHIFRQRMIQLESDMEGLATLMPRIGQQEVDQMEVGHVFVEDVRDAMVANCRMARLINVEIYLRRLETFRVTETIGRRPACAKVNLNVEQYVDDVYTLERTLRVWENELPVLIDLPTWEVPLTTFRTSPKQKATQESKRSSAINQNL
ncbi:hypothetical protein GOBAR_DD18619 [Gossypium barbadense]|nr:hypothetical protein GOBAR_DD18619 [Gossypium barbadense]